MSFKNSFWRLFILSIIISLSGLMGCAGGGGTRINEDIGTDTTWTKNNSPYIVSGERIVHPGATLTIEPGVEIRITALNAFIIKGKLSARGAQSEPIIWTTNLRKPHPESWRHLEFPSESLPGSILTFNEFRFAGSGIYFDNSSAAVYNCTFKWNNTGIHIWQGNPEIVSCVMEENLVSGINVVNAEPLIKDCTLTKNTAGLVVKFNGRPNLDSNKIFENSEYNLVLEEAGLTVDARNTWWGTDKIPEIHKSILDNRDNQNLGKVIINPIAKQ
jgi:Right handed beta helix region